MYDFKNVKLIISEIDGVLTDGKYTEDEIGNVLFKSFNYIDFDSINTLKQKGYKFVFLSEDNRINYNMCQRRNLPFYWGRNEDSKYKCLVDIFRRYNTGPDNTLFVPSRPSDRKCIHTVPISICPDDANLIKYMCYMNFTKAGGQGVLSDLVGLLEEEADIVDE